MDDDLCLSLPTSEDGAQEEQDSFLVVVSAFVFYRAYAVQHYYQAKLAEFDRLPPRHQTLLREAGFLVKLLEVERGIRANARFLNRVVQDQGVHFRPLEAPGANSDAHAWSPRPPGNYGDSQDYFTNWGRSFPLCDPRMVDAGGYSRSPGSPPCVGSMAWLGGPNLMSADYPNEPPGLIDRVYALFRQHEAEGRAPVAEFHMDKLRSTLKQVVRDWSVEGRAERDASYGPILTALAAHFNPQLCSNGGTRSACDINVLVPGAGLGRLAYEIAARGYSCQGNEFSSYMLFVSHFLLNRTKQAEEFTVYPYVHGFSNCQSRADQTRAVQIPDILPSIGIGPGVDFSMTAGDFVEAYGNDTSEFGAWDCVATCFFIDTATNVVNYMEIIYRLLKPGGIWINLGPLLFHFENNHREPSIELTLEEIGSVARDIGFAVSDERIVPSPYTMDSNSMLQYTYQCAFFTALKPVAAPE